MLAQHSTTSAAVRRGLVLLFILLFTAFAYTFLHEGGHALLGAVFGGALTAFNTDFVGFTAHAGIDGQFETWQRALISAAGVGLPLVVWTLFLLSRRELPKDNPALDWLLLVGSVGVYSTLLAWVVLPVLYLAGVEAADDAITFLRVTGWPPLLVSALALAGWAGGLALFGRKAGGLGRLRSRLRAATAWEGLTPASKVTLRVMGVLLVGIVAATMAINAVITTQLGPSRIGNPPEGYALAFEVELVDGERQAEAVYRFTLDAPTEVSFFFVLVDFREGPIELTLWGPERERFTFLRFEERAEIGRATVHPGPLRLEAGVYEIRLTAPQGRSVLSGFWKQGE